MAKNKDYEKKSVQIPAVSLFAVGLEQVSYLFYASIFPPEI